MFPIVVGVMLLLSSTDVDAATSSPRVNKLEFGEVNTTRKQEIADTIKTRREEFKQKLEGIRDERKQKILENLDTRITNVNAKWTERWNNVLKRLSEILAKIDARSDDSAVDIAVNEAEVVIARAQNAVSEQAGKTYDIEISQEETLGENAREALSEFYTDLRGVHAVVSEAREAVGKAVRALKGVEGE